MGLQESTKGNAQLTRENDIFHINQTTVLFNRDSTYSLVRKFICFFKKGHRNCKRHIFGEHFYSENARKLRFHVFLLFLARKYMISSFYLKWSEFKGYCEFCSNCESQGTQTELVKCHNLLGIWSTLGKMMRSYIF